MHLELDTGYGTIFSLPLNLDPMSLHLFMAIIVNHQEIGEIKTVPMFDFF